MPEGDLKLRAQWTQPGLEGRQFGPPIPFPFSPSLLGLQLVLAPAPPLACAHRNVNMPNKITFCVASLWRQVSQELTVSAARSLLEQVQVQLPHPGLRATDPLTHPPLHLPSNHLRGLRPIFRPSAPWGSMQKLHCPSFCSPAISRCVLRLFFAGERCSRFLPNKSL